MGKRVLDFDGYVKRVNEGLQPTNESMIGDFLSKIGKGVFSAAKKIGNLIKDGIISLIPSGPKKGTPDAFYFTQKDGPIVDQVTEFYSKTPFGEMNPLPELNESENYLDDVDEARIPLEYTGEDQSVRNVGPEELTEMLGKLYRSKQRGGRAKPIFIYGAPGIGKTQIVAQAADEAGVDMINLDLQFMSPEDFLGIPKVIDIEQPEYKEGKMVSAGKGVTRMNPPRNLPTDDKGGKGGFIFMDEMNRANARVLNSLMQFVQMGRIGEYLLPEGWVIVAAGNRPEDVTGAGQVAEFDFAMADRFNIINFVPDPKKWAEWAKGTGKFEPEIVGFVERNPELFHYLDNEKNALKFPTPRSWTDAALSLKDEIIDTGAKDWRDISTDTIFNIYSDSIGPSAAGKLKAYLDIIKRIPERDLEMIVTNPEKATPITKGPEFSNVSYGLYEMALRRAEEMNNGKATVENLYNIMKYYSLLDNLEILSWVYARIKEKYPEFAVTEDTLKEKDTPEGKMKIEAAMMVKKGMSGKGLIG
jgi:MoxR-like ATPase